VYFRQDLGHASICTVKTEDRDAKGQITRDECWEHCVAGIISRDRIMLWAGRVM